MTTPAQAAPPTDALESRDALLDKATRTLVAIVSIVGAAAAATGLLFQSSRGAPPWGDQRFIVGMTLLGLGGLASLLRRAGWQRLAMTLVLGGTQLSLVGNAIATGLGVHTLALAASPVLVAVAGGVAGNGSALALAALHLAAIFGLATLETQGWLPGRLVALQPSIQGRVVGHLLITVGGLASALLLNRILGAALRRAIGEEARLARLVQAAHNWAWEADARFRVTQLSDEFETLSGHKREDFLRMGEPGGAALVKDADYQALLEDIRAKRAYRDRINGFRAPDGRLLWTLSSGEPVFDAAGRHTGWRGVSHNITGERLALQQHQRTAAMLDRVLRASPDAICVAHIEDGRIRFANSGFCTLVGLSRDELLGRSGHELGLWPDSGEPRRLAAALAGSGLVRDFRSAIFVGGQWRDLLVSAASLDWDGEPATMLIARDITDSERGRIEAEAILDHASVGIALTRGGRFERVNHHWQEIFGGTEPRLAGGQPDLPSAQQVAGTALAFERDLVHPDGRRITVQFNARGLPARLAGRDGDDADRATLWLAEDVSERRRQERELQAAKQQAEGASHAKSAFLATMSHEIRTPLNGVLGLARLLQQGGPADAHRDKYLAHLAAAAESLNEIVSNVLDLSKIEAGHLELERIEFDLHALAQASFEGCAALGRERGLDMQIDLAPGLPRLVIGDPLRVRQIMANFLVNALKFTERGHIRLKLSAADTDRVRIVVADSGIGVPAALQERLFRPFAQADDSTTRRFGGTGLGLSICRELAARMQGRVGVQSDGASGSSFWAELALPTALTVDDTASRKRLPPPPRHPLAGQRLLVAEDNPVNRLIITALLQRLGAEVVEAEDGEQAIHLARAQAGRLDGVLMDLHMPKVDGLAATQLLRADPTTARLPIHAFTAAVLDQEREKALAAGMNGFIAKPVAEAEVIRVLGRH
ncbi:PAS domain-containing hybrid sensor histidine kinase/response regulator [Roseateles sp.]|uniref:ATP-binding protein n=1 Tax=Roseateles sp. TaxID=1971397 RepID=UPI0025FD547B|nr:PAS domain-containing hybrid sensor histidine kinase/response regulator [Roseateles sp.]MBV8035596.1 PAS domain S-box protein [Roseateles sp.]